MVEFRILNGVSWIDRTDELVESKYIDGLQCDRCRSQMIVHDDRQCGRIGNCGADQACEGCHSYKGSSEKISRFKCLSCGNIWSIMRKRPIRL